MIPTSREGPRTSKLSRFTPDYVKYNRIDVDHPKGLERFLDNEAFQLPYLALFNQMSGYSSDVLESLLVLCELLECNPPHIFLIGAPYDTFNGETHGFDEYISVIRASGGNGHLTAKEAEQVAKSMLSKLDI
jgi:hypothetical protein